MLSTWIADVIYCIRRLRSRPGYALLAVLTLALGIGGTASIYGIARAVLFDPLPYQYADDVGVFWKKTDWTEEEFLFIRGRVPGFQQVALYRQRDMIVRNGAEPARLIRGVTSSAELFDVLGAHPLLGRGFRAGDDLPGAEQVAIVSFALWQQLGGTSSVVGSRLTLDGSPRTVIGVMPRGFWFPDPAVRVWTAAQLSTRRNWNSTLVGRVAPGQNVRALDTPIAQLVAMLDERFDYFPQWDKTKDPHITPIADDLAGPMQPGILATLGAMALILLIACANVTALMLGQVHARSVEFAVRSALGASGPRLMQPVLVEALLVAIVAGALGGSLASAGFTILSGALPLGAWGDAVAPDWRVFASAMVIAAGAAVLVVLVPMMSASRGDLRPVLSGSRTGGVRGPRGRIESGLVIAEVALAVIVAAGAALLARTVSNLYAIDPGVRVDGVAVVDVMLGGGNRARLEQTLDELTTALGSLPGVRSVGLVQQLPLRGGGYNQGLEIDGRPDLTRLSTEYRVASAGYLEIAGFTLRRGRMLAASDRRDTERVIVVNEAFAQKYFGGIDPLGKMLSDEGGPARIVGVVANAVERKLTDAPIPVRYAAVAQMPWVDEAQTLVLRAAPGVDEASLLEPIQRTIAGAAPRVAVQELTTLSRVMDAAVGPARQVVVLLSILTTLALTLGAVGVYGVIAHFAARRRRDWAIRVALGLPGSCVITHVIGHGLLLVTAGIAVGVAGAAALTRLLASLLYGVGSIDATAFAASAAALLTVGVLASLLPAWRAGTTDPVAALREQ